MDSNNSIAYRRELRKKKILENAELRKQKIFGLNTNAENNIQDDIQDLRRPALRTNYEHVDKQDTTDEIEETSSKKDDKDETNSTKSFESQRSSKSQHQEDENSATPKDIHFVNDILRNIPDPISEYQAESSLFESPNINFRKNTSSFVEEEETVPVALNSVLSNSGSDYTSSFSNSNQSKNGGNLLTNASDRSFITSHSCLLFDILGHPVSPSFLAILVCLLIYTGFGNLVSNSLIIPFCVWQVQNLVASYSIVDTNNESTSLVSLALLLCGIQKSLISKYIWLLNIIKDIFMDFSIYFVTIVLWTLIIGFPSINVSV